MLKQIILLIAAFFLAIGCSDPDIEFDNDTFFNMSWSWYRARITNYSYIVTYYEGNMAPIGHRARVTVKFDSAHVDIEILDPESPHTDLSKTSLEYAGTLMSYLSRFGMTICEIYSSIQSWYLEESQKLERREKLFFEARYNTQYYYPEYIHLSVNNPKSNRIPAGYSYIIKLSEFQILEPEE